MASKGKPTDPVVVMSMGLFALCVVSAMLMLYNPSLATGTHIIRLIIVVGSLLLARTFLAVYWQNRVERRHNSCLGQSKCEPTDGEEDETLSELFDTLITQIGGRYYDRHVKNVIIREMYRKGVALALWEAYIFLAFLMPLAVPFMYATTEGAGIGIFTILTLAVSNALLLLAYPLGFRVPSMAVLFNAASTFFISTHLNISYIIDGHRSINWTSYTLLLLCVATLSFLHIKRNIDSIVR